MKTSLFLIFLHLIMLAFLLSGCTKTKTGTLIGTIELINDTKDRSMDPADFSGVTVALYPLAVLDTTLVRINTEYPQIGVLSSQHTNFDHREFQPYRTATSGVDGSFKISNIEAGTYNLVVFKELWGIRYLCQVEIEKAADNNAGTISMYPVTELSSTISTPTTFASGHTYHVNSDTSLLGPVAFEPNATVLVAPGKSLKIYGAVTTPDTYNPQGYWKVLSLQGMYTTEQQTITQDYYYDSVQFFGNDIHIRHGVLRQITNAVALRNNLDTSVNVIDDVLITQCGSGLYISIGSAEITRLMIANQVNGESSYGISVTSTSSIPVEISSSVIAHMYEGISLSMTGTYSITNCYLYYNTRALYLHSCTGSVTHNAFELNAADIVQSQVMTPTQITYNNFYNSRSYGIIPSRSAIMHYNNFFKTTTHFVIIWTQWPPQNSYVFTDLDANYNYWGVSNPDDYILDASDNSLHPDYPCSYYVRYNNPRLGNIVQSAGIE